MPWPSSRRAVSAVTLMGVSESRSNAAAGPVIATVSRAASRRRYRLVSGFIASFHLGVQFQNPLVYPRLHARGPGDAGNVAYFYGCICVYHAPVVIQGQG